MPNNEAVEAMRVESDRQNAVKHLNMAVRCLEAAGLYMAAALIKRQRAAIEYQAATSKLLAAY